MNKVTSQKEFIEAGTLVSVVEDPATLKFKIVMNEEPKKCLGQYSRARDAVRSSRQKGYSVTFVAPERREAL